MDNSIRILQDPEPGTHLLMFRGDTRTFSLTLPHAEKGGAWLRTNIGHASTARREIFADVLRDEPPLGRDWFDIPMKRIGNRHFRVTVPLCEVGHFEAKCFFLKKGESTPVWPPGPNCVVNVEPADTCCGNILYNAFVRQFGPNKAGAGKPDDPQQRCMQALDAAGYTVIPKSGTFRDLIKELDFIIGHLGCRIIQLLPINPTPTTYARMGRFGSPFAALSFTAVDPALAEFDSRATPMEQFVELVDAIHQRNAKVFIDIAINHTGWAARIHETHPQWLVRGPDGHIEVPGAWGVRWEDLTKLDYHHKDLWHHMANVFLTWCRRGVDGFRCDAGYMIPVPAWKYIVASVRSQFPDTIFLLEGLGGKTSVTRQILNQASFDWAYSELFQNYDRRQIEEYLPKAIEISKSDGITVHFAETHDNPRLAARSPTYAKMRTALCALCSVQGAFGFANGVEWFATEKINVHESPSLSWDADVNQVDAIRRLNTLLKCHPAFHDQTDLKLIHPGEGNLIILLRHNLSSGEKLLVVANLDDQNQTLASWDFRETGMDGNRFLDLLTETEVIPQVAESRCSFMLEPGQVLCLTADPGDIHLLRQSSEQPFSIPRRIERQRRSAKALDVFIFYNNITDLGNFNKDRAAAQLVKDPVAYCQRMNRSSDESRVVLWQWPRDSKREVMVPPEHFLLVRADAHFRACITDGNQVVGIEESLPQTDESFFALFSPLPSAGEHRTLALKLSVYSAAGCRHVEAPLFFLSCPEALRVQRYFQRSDIISRPLLTLGTNGRGAMLRAHVAWGQLTSRYDALLAANLNPELPEDRWIMFSRCRAWLVFQGYSQDINSDCQHAFQVDERRGIWEFHVPTGQGEYVPLSITAEMIAGQNATQLTFYRHPSTGKKEQLNDNSPVRLILRPDIEDRNFHDTTKAYLGPEMHWPRCVTTHSDGFSFTPDSNRCLVIRMSRGSFVWEPEWQYMVHRAVEKDRGLDPESDLFSPGYFAIELRGGEQTELAAQVSKFDGQKSPALKFVNLDKGAFAIDDISGWKPDEALKKALDQYIVKRANLKSVVAGYPWFLDWGRDAMIVVRGIIAAGRIDDARSILKQFGQFEKDGTLPNMIRGQDSGNRNTSDAPLWFSVACADLIAQEKNTDFLDVSCDNRTLREILVSIAQAYMAGTPNGIRMDPESGLIFSPAHFSWMDTNHPAGTPREGYPIEIQALWHHALTFLGEIDLSKNRRNWKKWSQKVQASILELFVLEKQGYLSDCLHVATKVPAHRAEADDALRPNQLLAVTLGAVTDLRVSQNIVTACQELLVPGGIRSLADRPVQRPLAIYHHGILLNDPNHPYQGKYLGDEDTGRKAAYHNGTVWTWMFPSFCEAWVKAFGKNGEPAARAWLASSIREIDQGCVGHVPEIMDGDFPHRQRGCDAQAWGVSELLRVWLQLHP